MPHMCHAEGMFLTSFVNKNGHVVEYVKAGHITPRGNIACCDGEQVHFIEGSSDRFTHVIVCNGLVGVFSCVHSEFFLVHTAVG